MKHLIVLLLVIFASFSYGRELKAIEPGAKAPDFKLKNYDGKPYALASILKDHKYTVVMFIATRCPVSNAYSTRMVKLYDTYTVKGIAFIGVNSNKSEDVKEILEHSKKNGYQFVVLKDDGNKIADAYGASVTPETFVLDAKGIVVYHGRIDDSKNPDKVKNHDLDEALTTLLAGKTLASGSHPAMGCSIKRIGED
ncbi:MAG: thioredoxin family protein [Bacteroidota bacterium]